jgi:hypothetical protein
LKVRAGAADDGRDGKLQPQQGCEFKRAAGGSRASLPGGGSKRSVRAPRMRWTTALHARFMHAVQLLGGHESKLSSHTPHVFVCR